MGRLDSVPCVPSSNRLSQACFHSNCGGGKNARRDTQVVFSKLGLAFCLLEPHLSKKVTRRGPASQLGGRALRGSMVRAWVQGGEKNRSCGCNPATTAFTCNFKVTLWFIVKLGQATSLHTANIYPSPPWERPSSCRVQGKQRPLRGGGATACLLKMLYS